MHKIVNPKQTRLFDPFDHVLTEKIRKRLLDGWAGVFHHIIITGIAHVKIFIRFLAPCVNRGANTNTNRIS